MSSQDEHLFDLCIETAALASIYEQQNEIGRIASVRFYFPASILSALQAEKGRGALDVFNRFFASGGCKKSSSPCMHAHACLKTHTSTQSPRGGGGLSQKRNRTGMTNSDV